MKYTSRRKFLTHTGAGFAGLGLSKVLVPSISVAQVTGVNPAPVKNIINIFLSGGYDGLQMVLPRNATLFSALSARRPRIMNYAARAANGTFSPPRMLSVSDLVAGNSEVGLHPALGEPVVGGGLTFAALMQQNQVKLVHQVGNATNNGSHEAATNMFFTGAAHYDPASPAARQHWLARLADYHQLASFNVFRLGPGAGPYFERALSALPPVAAQRLAYLVYNNRGADLGGALEANRSLDALTQMLQAEDRAALPPHGRRLLDAMLSTRPQVDQMAAILAETLTGTYGDTHIGALLSDTARVIKYYERFGSTEPRIFSLCWSGSSPEGAGPSFDTHTNQEPLLTGRMRELNQALSALHRDLQGPMWSKTIGVLTAEFGRRIDMNSDGGTDHGWGYVSFLFGGGLEASTPIVMGDLPANGVYTGALTDLLPASTDVRSVLGEVLTVAGMSPQAAFPGFLSPRSLGITPAIT